MSGRLDASLHAALRGSPLAPKLEQRAAPFLEKYGAEPADCLADERVRLGLARVLASQPEAARFLANRSRLFARVCELDPGYLERRADELPSERLPGDDLEVFLDGLRLLRREETLLAACLDLSGAVPFESVSSFLSVLAESIIGQALDVAWRNTVRATPAPLPCVVGMGKIAGREFTYASDLDLVFLYAGGTECMAGVSRIGQRLIDYLSTMTGAGVAYAVDTRLRPSGQQGTLVTSFEAFERYQREQAQLWEHLALVRARALAGDREPGQRVLAALRSSLPPSSARPWAEVAAMRARVEAERAREGPDRLDLKTGPGGLMDVEFLAAGGALEAAGRLAWPAIPSVPALLRARCPGPAAERLLQGYRLLRLVEARARWLSGRAVDHVERHGRDVDLLAELVEPGLSPAGLFERLGAVRGEIRAGFRAVLEAGTVDALGRSAGTP